LSSPRVGHAKATETAVLAAAPWYWSEASPQTRHLPVSKSAARDATYEKKPPQYWESLFWLMALTCFNHLEKYEFVNGKDDIPYIMENKRCFKPPITISPFLNRNFMGF